MLVGWWIVASYVGLKDRVQPVEDSANSHGFIRSQAGQRSTMLLIQSSDSGETIEKLAIVQADFETSKVTVLLLPTNLSDGQTAANAFWRAGYYKELQQMVEGQLGLPIDGYLIEENANQTSSWSDVLTMDVPMSWIGTGVGLPVWLASFGEIKTTLVWNDYLQLLWMIRSATVREELAVTLPEQGMVETDGLVVLKPELVDARIEELLGDPRIIESKTTVVVENATTASGLASQMGRFVANMGGEVVATVPADGPETRSQLIADKESVLTQQLSRFLGIPLTIKERSGRERSEVELVLGSDALGRLGR